MAGKTAVVLGYGSIGRRVGALCGALGMTVIGVRRVLAEGGSRGGEVEVRAPEDLWDLLPRADALLICAPLAEQPRGSIGHEELARLPAQAILVNVGRAAIVDEAALFDGLQTGELAGAGLDVWYQYPKGTEDRTNTPPAALPFWELNNVVLSPHRAGSTLETERLRAVALASVLNDLAQGKTPETRVNLDLGY